MDDDVATSNRLVSAIIINHVFTFYIFPPDLDAEGIWRSVTSLEDKYVQVTIWRQWVVNRADTLILSRMEDQ